MVNRTQKNFKQLKQGMFNLNRDTDTQVEVESDCDSDDDNEFEPDEEIQTINNESIYKFIKINT